MRLLLSAVLALLAAQPAPAQPAAGTGLPPEVLRLARIKLRMEKNLLRQPNYTCIKTITRSRRNAPARRHRLVDTLRLEVALVNGREMFSWPGAREFSTSDPREIVPTGAIGSGVFSSHARAVFLSQSAVHTYVGPEELDGRACERYDFRVPLSMSGYTLRLGEIEAAVAYYGSYWVESESLDLVRLDVRAAAIPESLQLRSAHTVLNYEHMQIGGGEFLLPRSAVTALRHIDGGEIRNETRFSACRQYSGESTLSFAPPPEEGRPEAASVETVSLPPGLDLHLALTTPIEAGVTAVGDPLTATVLRAAKRQGEVIVPKGAVVTGRLALLKEGPRGVPHFVVGFAFDEITFDGKRAALRAEPVRFVSFLGGQNRPMLREEIERGQGGLRLTRPPNPEETPGVTAFYVKGGMLRIPLGSRMIWRTVGNNEED